MSINLIINTGSLGGSGATMDFKETCEGRRKGCVFMGSAFLLHTIKDHF